MEGRVESATYGEEGVPGRVIVSKCGEGSEL